MEKLHMFESLVLSIEIAGYITWTPTQACIKALESTQFQMLKRILRLKPLDGRRGVSYLQVFEATVKAGKKSYHF